MNLKIKALLITAGLMVSALLASLGLDFIRNTFTAEQITTGVMVFCMAGLVYLMYSLVLVRLEMQENLKKLTDSL
jgi:uncharacterized membrane protein